MKFFLEKNNNFKNEVVNDRKKLIPFDWNKGFLSKFILMNKKNITKETKEIYYVDISSVQNNQIVQKQKLNNNFPSRAKRIIEKDDIIVSTVRPNLKCFSYVEETTNNLVCSTGFVTLTSVEISSKFLFFIFNQNDTTEYLIQNCIGGTYPTFNPKIFNDFEIAIPNISEQNLISDFLWERKKLIDSYINQKNLALKTIKSYQQIILNGKTRMKLSKEKEQELLSKDVISLVEEKAEKEQFSFFNINEGKFEEFVSLVDLTKDIVFYQNDEANWKTKEVNELQKQLPKDWNVEQLYKKVNFIKGKSIPENQLNYNGEGLKYLKTTEFWLDSSSKRDTVHYTGKVEEKYMKKKDEYVFSMDGFNNKIGQGTLGLISNEDEGIVSTSFYKLEKNDIYHLVVNVLKSNYVQNFIMRLGEGTTVYHAGKYMKNLQGIFPKSTVEQKLLSMIFEKEEKLVDSLKEKIKLEEKVFKYLQQELLSGRIRIKVEE